MSKSRILNFGLIVGIIVCMATVLIAHDGSHFFIDPLDGNTPLPEEPFYRGYLRKLPYNNEPLRFAHGKTEMSPVKLTVGHPYDFTWTYFPETKKLKAGAVVMFSIPHSWTQPQTSNAESAGFVKAVSHSGRPLSITLTQNENVSWWVKVTIPDTELMESGWIRVHYKKAVVQRFPQEKFLNFRNAMRTVIDFTGEGDYAVVMASKTMKPVIKAGPPSRLLVVSPAVVKPGQSIDIRFIALDFCDNPSYPKPTGEFFLALPESPFKPLATLEVKPEDNGSGSFTISVPKDKETFQVIVSNKKDNLCGKSPLMVVDENFSPVYFGDIHNHSLISDGLKPPEATYAHARNGSLLDFCAISDHNGDEVSKIEGPFLPKMIDEQFAVCQQATEKYNEPGRFVTIQAYEQNGIKGWPGHRNVYFRGIAPGLFKSNKLDDLYAYLEGHPAILIPHHHIINRTVPHLTNTKFERLAEMYSMHCGGEVKGSPLNNFATSPAKKENGTSAREMLEAGHRIGFIGASDNHQGMPGLGGRPGRFTNLAYSMGIAGVHAPALTREAIFDGLYDRHCYATTGARIYVNFMIDGKQMGSEIVSKRKKKLDYQIVIAGTDEIAKIELVQNGEVRSIWQHDGSRYVKLSGNWKCAEHTWAYLRVTQVDRHIAWSSPIWIDVND